MKEKGVEAMLCPRKAAGEARVKDVLPAGSVS